MWVIAAVEKQCYELNILLPYDLQFFAKEGPGGEKTEEPTGKRLQDARKKGQVAKSKEVTNGFSLLAFFLTMAFWLEQLGYRFEMYFPTVYDRIPELVKLYDGQLPFQGMRVLVTQLILNSALYAAPFMLVGVVVAIIVGFIQVGRIWTFEPFKPKFSKMNPLSGLKRIFSTQSLMDLGLAILKIVLISFVVYNYLSGREESLFLLYDIGLRQGIYIMGDIIIQMGIRISFIYMIIAAVDLIYQRHKHHEEMKMTKQEVKDEMKNSEGDPQIKSKQRQRMREASMRRMMQQLPQADVVITNPSHYAVAVLYDADRYTAPIVVAKGADHLAQRIKDVAKENEIEIVENKPLARMLYANVEIGEMVPPELYKAVAEILAYVYHLQGKL